MLFSERYANLIEENKGQLVDHICGDVDLKTKESLETVMYRFAQPQIEHPNRYDNFEVKITALEKAINAFNKSKNYPYVNTRDNIFDHSDYRPLSAQFTPHLFDVIELQYDELLGNEKIVFQSEINSVLEQNDIPWLLHDGRMIKIDSEQFELDLKVKTISLMHSLKECEPKFQSAYDEFMKAWDFYEKSLFPEAISNAEKSYESVLKVIVGATKGDVKTLTAKFISSINPKLPATINPEGFRASVMMALPYIRNNSSSDHGAGEFQVVIEKSFAKLSLNIAAALNTYLIEEYKKTLHDEPSDEKITDDELGKEN
ncbi:MAG: abortive infection family protein [Ruminococcaceae bacterium]|nr:abortive infection family protein [Oscillospiraceae bacterium]